MTGGAGGAGGADGARGELGAGGELGFETRAIHAGQDADPTTGAVTTPIYQTSTYAQSAVGDHLGYEYSRTGNPTRTALEGCLASLEQAEFGRAFSSGMAAEDALLRTALAPGDHVVIPHDAYGGTYRLVAKVHRPAGISFTPADLSHPESLAAALRPETKLVWIESPTNPLLSIVDIAAVCAAAHAHGARVVVDNTFASPYLQQPLTLGADAVVHSTTKYISGHSDVVGGFVATNDVGWDTDLGFVQNAVGAVPGPFDCFLALRGVKTLAVRMERHCANAAAVAEMLCRHPAVAEVRYPGLPQHPGHEVAVRQMRGFGGMVSFTVAGGEAAALAVAAATKVFTLAESLGAVESLIEHPGRMTHASVAGSPLEVPDNLVRLSVGIETAADLLADLRAALDLLTT
ncbi:MAG: cystathionine gamma-synthase [Acidimicrobiaceae bacterium]|nr:cystathionine gamma-synthase [Acidimicrobiaceae bacterium]